MSTIHSHPKKFGFGFDTQMFWVLGMGLGMKPIPKTQTQIFLGVNVWSQSIWMHIHGVMIILVIKAQKSTSIFFWLWTGF